MFYGGSNFEGQLTAFGNWIYQSEMVEVGCGFLLRRDPQGANRRSYFHLLSLLVGGSPSVMWSHERPDERSVTAFVLL